jgi:hypothetical protein
VLPAGIVESCDLPRVTANPSVDGVCLVVIDQFIVVATETAFDCDKYLVGNVSIPVMVLSGSP